MSLSLLAPARTVLLISDDALFIYSTSARGVKMVETVPWSVENFENDVASLISKECGGKPVLIVNDMVEQHYRKEKVPRVSVLDKQSVVKRKLHVTFPNYSVRAALPLKEKAIKTNKSMAGDIYIFAAVPSTDAFDRTLAAATKSLAPIVGVLLLPIEASDMVKKISDKISAKGEKKSRWTIFMGQHRGGGLRQIVIKDGELALTRMTSIAEADSESWADEVNQEFQATMSYLSRFGFDEEDGLNVILVSESRMGEKVGELLDVSCDFHSVSADDVAHILSVKLGKQSSGDNFFADVLHVAWIGRKNKFILPMKAKQVDSVSQPRQVAVLAILLMILGGAFQCYQCVDIYQKLTEENDNYEVARHRTAQLKLQYDKEVKRKGELGFDIELIQGALSVYDHLEENQISVIPLFTKIGESLGRDMRIDQIQVTRGGDPNDDIGRFSYKNSSDKDKGEPLFWANMQMTFPSSTDTQKGNEEVRALGEKLQRLLPEHVVEVVKLLEDYEYSKEIVVETGGAPSQVSAQDYVAEIKIKGPIVDD
ncbi:MAG: hypothetical protein KAJ40_05640 [Alphaproteobacteria bacterium]|nr:hypothetical protein [Alphaproteobacteria bacterium]